MFYAPRMRTPLVPIAALAVVLAAALPGTASAQTVVPGEVVVRYAEGVDRAERADVQRETGVGEPEAFAPLARRMQITDGDSISETVRELRGRPEVASAAPNPIAHIAAINPRDPGAAGVPGGWRDLQWNFLPDIGIDAPDAWQHVLDAGARGGRGTTVAVLDTGVAYSGRGRFKRSPDFSRGDFTKGYDFVGDDDRPNDQNGHGTHVAGTIGEKTDNDVAVTGIAYGAKIMPVRVLDRRGDGDSVEIAQGIRFAARHHADVINLSFEFHFSITAADIPEILSALRYAHRKGTLVVAASGNDREFGDVAVAYPARAPNVVAVGGTTERRCLAEYSNEGEALDLVAPGGGEDADLADDPNCRPDLKGRPIVQMTFTRTVRRFSLPRDYVGTSMAAPHVSATAALVIASGVLGDHPTPRALEERLEATAQDLGPPGFDVRYGAGLLNAANATDPAIPAT
jgi:serine protease